jgi:hypothetical protein
MFPDGATGGGGLGTVSITATGSTMHKKGSVQQPCSVGWIAAKV